MYQLHSPQWIYYMYIKASQKTGIPTEQLVQANSKKNI